MPRTKFEIIKEILTLCKTPQRKTHIIYKCNLNFLLGKRYLGWCFIKKWIIKDEERNLYEITELGKDYLNLLNPVLEADPSLLNLVS